MIRFSTSLVITVCIAFSSAQGLAAGKTKKAPAKAKATSDLSTNVEFDPMTVHGRYQYAAEGLAKVEDEKSLYDLLGPRKNFKDRMKQMARQK